ncbi:glycoside hydrolase family 38 N-terminal domain-containing protein [Paramaledivibacter caminithermalis]|jgi:mannosylglycerate hydrolase|uniref:Mannosylglycerate hydrolase n=1 Tax=Paramaledivibacter caminithermalis (strain DSM 15212 / CIP 107654 / DViRD3) TaxID=1121301 RepID=A0A1M6MRY3_PARC5|nr:glycoside hydrolase family 38 C-terminal domain-containing protein [Paramaledivibacter caminithermalis]SHJ86150.1 mannosylglycerate hydrolase [Paramaledivibacter caminithermalis DSM 15212]
MRFHIVSHTHWDREWYKTFEEYRVKLVRVMDDLMDLLESNKDYSSFMLDGQTIVLEDYLEIRPENRDRLSKLIQEKRIIVGPWYIQPDEFIPSGEALIRNLLIGIQIGEEFGPVMEIGYLPDSFGQSAFMPQIFSGFNMKDSIIWRGIADEDIKEKEFWWKGLDGSRVLNHYLPLGYENAKWLCLKDDKNEEVINTNIKAQQPLTSTDQILMLCGYDQREPNPDLPEIIERLNKQYKEKGYEFIFSSLEEYVEAVRKAKDKFHEITGEFRKGKHMRVHASIGSTRLDIKRLNFDCQILYEKYVEPIGTLAHLWGFKYDNSMINQGWKYIIQNQAHDSIGNVCTDKTHDEMEIRYSKAKQIGETIMAYNLQEISSRMKLDSNRGRPLIVFNTLLNPRKSIVEVEVFLDNEDFTLVDRYGKEIEYQIIDIEKVDLNDFSIESHFIGKNASQECYRVKFNFIANVAGYGYTTYYIQNKKYITDNINLILNDNVLENEYFIVEINEDGSFNIQDKASGKIYFNQNIIEESGNSGDEYDYSPPEKDILIYSKDKKADIEIISNGSIMAKVKITHQLYFPKDTYTKFRSTEMEKSEITSYITMYKGIKRIEIKTIIDNKVSNHRLRALFDSHINSSIHYADQQFGILNRKNYLKQVEYWQEDGWQEKYYPIYNQHKFVSVYDGEKGLQIMNKGLVQYEIIGKDNPKIALTLLCTTDYMGKQDLVNRPGRRSGLHVATPKSDMLKKFKAEYAITAINNDIEMNYLADDYVYPLYSYMPASIDEEGTTALDEYYPISIDNEYIATSVIKKAERGEALIVRLYNTQNRRIDDINIKYDSQAFKDIRFVNLREEEINRDKSLEIRGSNINIASMNSNEIITLKLLPR